MNPRVSHSGWEGRAPGLRQVPGGVCEGNRSFALTLPVVAEAGLKEDCSDSLNEEKNKRVVVLCRPRPLCSSMPREQTEEQGDDGRDISQVRPDACEASLEKDPKMSLCVCVCEGEGVCVCVRVCVCVCVGGCVSV